MTTYTLHPIEDHLLAVLWSRLWKRGLIELVKLGHTRASGYLQFLEFGRQAVDGAILCADGEPAAVSGICSDDGCYFTFFQAADSFEEHAQKITRELRRHTKQCHGTLYIYSVLVHPDTERWFNYLDLSATAGPAEPRQGHPLYRFRRK